MELEHLERDSPHAIAVLDTAMREDRERTVRFLQRLLDPQDHVSVLAIAALDRPGTWDERWAAVDAFLGRHQ